MKKVIPLFSNGTVQDILCQSADKNFTEVLVIGKGRDGLYYLNKSEFSSSCEIVGVLEMGKQWVFEQMD
jgi:hypothetical protein